jgi:hypothetical protein
LHLCVVYQFFLRLADHLERILEQLTTIELDDPRMSKIVEELKEVFESCCGDFPEAVCVQYSYNVFQNKVQSDLRNLEDDKVRMERKMHDEKGKTHQLSENQISGKTHEESTVPSSLQSTSFNMIVKEAITVDKVPKEAKGINWDSILPEVPGQKRKQSGEVIDETINFAQASQDVGASSPVLAPLKLVTENLKILLKNAKVSTSG